MKISTISDEQIQVIATLVSSLPSSSLKNEVEEILVQLTEDLDEI
jgi:hypothetical protein